MNDDVTFNSLQKEAHRISDDIIRGVSKDLHHDLVSYALKHRQSGDLARNITLTKKKNGIGYIIDGGTRAKYRDKTYHPMVFFVDNKAKGQEALSRALTDARRNIGKLKK